MGILIGPSGFNLLPASTFSPALTSFIFATHGSSGGVQVGLKIIAARFAQTGGQRKLRIADADLVRLNQAAAIKNIHAISGSINDDARIGRDRVSARFAVWSGVSGFAGGDAGLSFGFELHHSLTIPAS